MKKRFLLLIFLPFTLLAQNNNDAYGLKDPNADGKEACDEFVTELQALPPDFSYGLYLDGREMIAYFRTEKGFNALFNHRYDGLAVDIVERWQYRCGQENGVADSWAYKGRMLPPLYLKELEGKTVKTRQNYFFVSLGQLPSRYKPKDVELNMMVIQKKFLCENRNAINVEANHWSLLEMGLYRDSLAMEDGEAGSQLLSKVLRFSVPFDKNRVVFDRENIQPLYDSLQLTDYNIKEISIRAYASVEGTLEKNLKLQEGRANSIVQALQSYQTPEISATVVTNENWVDLLNDIRGTEFEYLASMSKEEVKAELTKQEVLQGIEPILSRHRKALIELKLQKKFTEAETDPVLLKKFFDQSIREKNIEEALYIQNIVYELIRDEKLPDEFFDRLDIPKSTQYGPLLNNRWVFDYELNGEDIYKQISAFERLSELLPDNPKITYNLAALRIKAWTQGELITNQEEIVGLLDRLRAMDIPEALLLRLATNYKIILIGRYDMNMDYSRKRANLMDIMVAYYDLDLSDEDLLSLGKFMAQNTAYDYAEGVVENRAYDVDAAEDLIFFYLQLKIGNSAMSRNINFRTLMLNAIDKNALKFCEMFKSRHDGGVSFQLLDFTYLKDTYCESCSFQSPNQ